MCHTGNSSVVSSKYFLFKRKKLCTLLQGKVLMSAPVLFQEAVQTKDENEALRRHRKRMTISATVRTKLRLALQIFAIDSKRKLGFTYGPIGLISLAAFVRFLILYSKTAMIIYKQTQLL